MQGRRQAYIVYAAIDRYRAAVGVAGRRRRLRLRRTGDSATSGISRYRALNLGSRPVPFISLTRASFLVSRQLRGIGLLFVALLRLFLSDLFI